MIPIGLSAATSGIYVQNSMEHASALRGGPFHFEVLHGPESFRRLRTTRSRLASWLPFFRYACRFGRRRPWLPVASLRICQRLRRPISFPEPIASVRRRAILAIVPVYRGDQLQGFVYLNSDFANATGYSGKPIQLLVGIDAEGRADRPQAGRAQGAHRSGRHSGEAHRGCRQQADRRRHGARRERNRARAAGRHRQRRDGDRPGHGRQHRPLRDEADQERPARRPRATLPPAWRRKRRRPSIRQKRDSRLADSGR